jgi:hypothetical protein
VDQNSRAQMSNRIGAYHTSQKRLKLKTTNLVHQLKQFMSYDSQKQGNYNLFIIWPNFKEYDSNCAYVLVWKII